MPKKNAKTASVKSSHDNYELPTEVDFKKTKFIGFGLEALDRHIAAKTVVRQVTLASDVANDFTTDEEINNALRLVQQLKLVVKPVSRKKSA